MVLNAPIWLAPRPLALLRISRTATDRPPSTPQVHGQERGVHRHCCKLCTINWVHCRYCITHRTHGPALIPQVHRQGVGAAQPYIHCSSARYKQVTCCGPNWRTFPTGPWFKVRIFRTVTVRHCKIYVHNQIHTHSLLLLEPTVERAGGPLVFSRAAVL